MYYVLFSLFFVLLIILVFLSHLICFSNFQSLKEVVFKVSKKKEFVVLFCICSLNRKKLCPLIQYQHNLMKIVVFQNVSFLYCYFFLFLLDLIFFIYIYMTKKVKKIYNDFGCIECGYIFYCRPKLSIFQHNGLI